MNKIRMLGFRKIIRTNKQLAAAICVMLLLIVDGKADDAVVSEKAIHHDPVDWTAIRINSKWVGKHVVIEGYLELLGTGDQPRITLWDTKEAMQVQRNFHYIEIDSKSATDMIIKKFGSGADNWRVLQGLFVKISGSFEIQDEGLQYISLGTMSDVKRIDIINNGLVLLRLE